MSTVRRASRSNPDAQPAGLFHRVGQSPSSVHAASVRSPGRSCQGNVSAAFRHGGTGAFDPSRRGPDRYGSYRIESVSVEGILKSEKLE